MSSVIHVGRCRHVKLNGARCTMPIRPNRELCFDHDRRREAHRRRRFITAVPEASALAPLVSFVQLEDHTSVLENLNAIAMAFAHHQIDHRQVGSLTFLMQTALKTLRQMNEIELPPRAEDLDFPIVYDDCGMALAVDEPAPAEPAVSAATMDTEAISEANPAPQSSEAPLTETPATDNLNECDTPPLSPPPAPAPPPEEPSAAREPDRLFFDRSFASNLPAQPGLAAAADPEPNPDPEPESEPELIGLILQASSEPPSFPSLADEAHPNSSAIHTYANRPHNKPVFRHM